MKKMTEKAQKIWDAFCGELTQEPTDDMREALATAIRIIDECGLFDLADELETL